MVSPNTSRIRFKEGVGFEEVNNESPENLNYSGAGTPKFTRKHNFEDLKESSTHDHV